jgi:hypothetical protein
VVRIDTDERRRRLGIRHRLATPALDAVEAAAATVGLHSSDPATVFLSARARVDGLAVTDLERALYEDRSLLRVLAMRRTMFVVPVELAAVMNSACTRALATGQRARLIKLMHDQRVVDQDPEAWLEAVEAKTLAALERLGEATAAELSAEVPELKVQFEYQGGTFGMSTRVLFLLATHGLIIRGRPQGSWKSTLYRWAPIERWLEGGLAEPPEEQARVELVRRWLRSYGPGTMTDLTWWTGWGKRVTAAALKTAGAVEAELDDGTGFMLEDDLDVTPLIDPWVALLPALDPTMMGWKEREWYCPAELAAELFDRNGNAGPTIWADGRVVGGWSQHADGTVVTELLGDIGSEAERMVDEQAARLTGWLGDMRIIPRFRTPLERRLAG